MKYFLVVSALLVPLVPAAADTSLREMIGAASSCSDASLKEFASRTCEPPQQIAAQAVAKCQDKWNAVADKAVGPPAAGASPKERARSLKIYSDAMENEYVRIAELKAIDMRTAAGRCGFD